MESKRPDADIVASLAAAPRAHRGVCGSLLSAWRTETGGALVVVSGDAGAGSTATMLAALLAACGQSVVQATAAHVHRWRERVRCNGEAIDPAALAAAIDASGLEGEASSAEMLLAAAVAVARDTGAETLIVEAPAQAPYWAQPTTCDRVIVATTSDAAWLMEHLPHAVAATSEVVMAPQRESVAEAVREATANGGATLSEVATACRIGKVQAGRDSQRCTIQTPAGRYDLALPLLGGHQRANLATALLAAGAVDPKRAAKALQALRLPLRLELLKRSPLVLADAADNAPSLRALERALPEILERARLTVVATVAADTPLELLTETIGRLDAEVRVAFSANERAPADEAARRLRKLGVGAQLVGAPGPALQAAIDGSGPRDAVLVVGSLRRTAEARAYLLGLEQDPV
ncbi:MAG: hypothetical protein V3V06_06725 [Dehalococcoidia bacterium]